MSEYLKGAAFARDKVLDLLEELQGVVDERFGENAVEAARESLGKAYRQIEARFGKIGDDGFLSEEVVAQPTFGAGFAHGIKVVPMHMEFMQVEIGSDRKYMPEFQALQWALNEVELQKTAWRAEAEELAAGSLAQRLNDFYKDFDFYDYQDSASCFGSEEEVVVDIEKQLENPEAVRGILDTLADIRENGELDDEQLKSLNELVLDLSEVQVNLGMSVRDVLSEALERSEESKKGKIVVEILQVPTGDAFREFRFSHLDWLKDGIHSVVPENYKKVYEFSVKPVYDLNHEVSVMDLLEQVYTTLNMNHPDDYRGRSMSVSDVVVLRTGKTSKAYYCDSIGFEPLPDSFVEALRKQKDVSSPEL